MVRDGPGPKPGVETARRDCILFPGSWLRRIPWPGELPEQLKVFKSKGQPFFLNHVNARQRCRAPGGWELAAGELAAGELGAGGGGGGLRVEAQKRSGRGSCSFGAWFFWVVFFWGRCRGPKLIQQGWMLAKAFLMPESCCDWGDEMF